MTKNTLIEIECIGSCGKNTQTIVGLLDGLGTAGSSACSVPTHLSAHLFVSKVDCLDG
jgi:hypothetical protein